MLRSIGFLACIMAPLQVAAQVPIPRPPDSTATDSLAARPDSSGTDRLLAVSGNTRVKVETISRLGFGDLEPAGSRIVLNSDSLGWATAHNVAELIAIHAPVFLWRGGWLERPEMPNMLGRGAGNIEYVVDGMPLLPVGPDSVAIDPSLWSLDLLQRIEIELAPGSMRVFLYTRNHDRLAPRTSIAVSTGDRSFSKYFGSFEKRYSSGIGLALAGSYTGVDAPTGGTGAANLTNAWMQLGWQRSARFGINLQYLVQAPERAMLLGASNADTLDPGLSGTRSDLQFRASWRGSDAGLGKRLDILAARSAWSGDSVHTAIGSFGAIAGWRGPTWSAELQALHHTAWTPLDTRLALGITPLAGLTGSLEGLYQRHTADRVSALATGRIGLDIGRLPAVPFLGIRPPGRFRLGATVRYGDRVVAPSIESIPAQSIADYELMASVEGSLLSATARWASLDVWQPLAFRQFAAIPGFARQPRTDWLTVSARLTPRNWLALSSNFQQPLHGATPDGVPPKHAWTSLTVDSRFLRNFPSGIFRLKVQANFESWSPGIIGRTVDGDAIDQPGLSFMSANLELRLGPFVAFWDRVNFQAVRKGVVPGYPILSLGSSYGIRWSFDN